MSEKITLSSILAEQESESIFGSLGLTEERSDEIWQIMADFLATCNKNKIDHYATDAILAVEGKIGELTRAESYFVFYTFGSLMTQQNHPLKELEVQIRNGTEGDGMLMGPGGPLSVSIRKVEDPAAFMEKLMMEKLKREMGKDDDDNTEE